MRNIQTICFIATMLLCSACARQVLPPGGPADTTPPSIVSSVPATRTLNFHGASVALEFSEYVDRARVRENLFISPPIPVELDWSGREVEIEFTDTLQPQTTYAITLGTEYADRAGNKPENAYTLIFSTGDRLDSGIVRGRIVDENAAGAFVFLYPLAGIQVDTLNPRTTKPKYRTQVGKNGEFEFQALSKGRYRVFAIRDEFRNEVYDFGIDAFGTTTGDVDVDEGAKATAMVRLGPVVDNTPPQLYSAAMVDNHILRVECSEAIDTASVHPESFLLELVGEGQYPPPSFVAAYVSPSRRFSVELVLSQALPVASQWRLVAVGLRDVFGNSIADTANTVMVNATDNADSLLATLLHAPFADSTVGVELSERFSFVWSTAIDTMTAAEGVLLTDSTGRTIPSSLQWLDNNICVLVPQKMLMANMWYRISLAAKGMRDVLGRAVRDTSLVVRFLTADPGNYGTVSGSIADSLGGNCSYIIALTTEDKKKQFRATLTSVGAWEFNDIPPGSYTLSVFCDADGNGIYSYGDAFPYKPTERFVVYSQPISVRPRWTVEDVVLRF